MEITLKNITKKFNNEIAVDNVNLTVIEGELLALLGSSGCGKTTLLRIVAGLLKQDEGQIFLNDKDISAIPAQNRNTAMVFQNYALFPHLTVEENIAYGLKVRKINKHEIYKRVQDVLKKVELEGYEKRKINELSGGQKQRAALARSLVIEPNILLFDEPLSNLDEKLRTTMRKEIRRIQKDTGITSIYVTHDQKEALAIADRIAVMNNGVIQQIAKPEEIYYKPTNYFTANFLGQPNIIKINKQDITNYGYVSFLGKKIILDNKYTELEYILLRPEEIELSYDGIDALVLDLENTGSVTRYKLKINSKIIFADFFNKINKYNIEVDDIIKVDFDEESLHFF